jgi:ComF family protein
MTWLTALTHEFSQLYSKVFPIPCLLCGLPSRHYALCTHCAADLPLLGTACRRCACPLDDDGVCGRCLQQSPIQDRSFSLLRYQGTAKRCVTAFKYRQQLHLCRLFADMMSDKLSRRLDLPDCLVPIPLHPMRLRKRGFNQAVELARMLAGNLALNCRTDLLLRTRNTRPQSELPYKERRRNLKRAFACYGTDMPAHIAIIDDVMTSGHTCGEAARALRAAGAEIIEVWTIARAISHY